MQEQTGAMGSFSETLGFEHGSASSDAVNSPSNLLPQYMYLNPTSQEGHNVSMWTVGETGSSSGSNQVNQGHIEPRPDRGWSSLMKPCPEPPSSVLSLGDHGSSFSDPFGPSSDPFEVEACQVSRKRKAVELTIGQSSSEVGSSSALDLIPADTRSDPILPRLGLSISNRPVLENTRRTDQQVDPLLDGNNSRENDVSGLRLSMPAENPSSHPGQPDLRDPPLRRSFQSTSRWSRNRSPNLVISGDQDELDSISEHPLFTITPPSNSTTASQPELIWSSNGGGDGGENVNNGVNANATSSRSGSTHSRRLSAFLRRSLLSAIDREGGEGQNGNFVPRIPPALRSSSSSTSSQDVGAPPDQHHPPRSRSSLLLGRQLEGAFAFPYHSRIMTPGSEGRGRIVSEIRNVLDLMRRGEPLRFEDLMVLDQSVFGVADVHDRHRDMRLDIDNMSYEELLALEERIGYVNTGLTEETISKHIKQKQYVVEIGQPDLEPCCICQEEYKHGDDLGTLECGHEFHHGCIKQWLQQKNLCPICKSTGFTAAETSETT